jgi:hypothetical protein
MGSDQYAPDLSVTPHITHADDAHHRTSDVGCEAGYRSTFRAAALGSVDDVFMWVSAARRGTSAHAALQPSPALFLPRPHFPFGG